MKRGQKLEDLSGERFLIFKHSSRCPISSHAHAVVQSIEPSLQVPVYLIVVPEDRLLAEAVARHYGVPHHSPQVILVERGKAFWHCSHFEITPEGVLEAAGGK